MATPFWMSGGQGMLAPRKPRSTGQRMSSMSPFWNAGQQMSPLPTTMAAPTTRSTTTGGVTLPYNPAPNPAPDVRSAPVTLPYQPAPPPAGAVNPRLPAAPAPAPAPSPPPAAPPVPGVEGPNLAPRQGRPEGGTDPYNPFWRPKNLYGSPKLADEGPGKGKTRDWYNTALSEDWADKNPESEWERFITFEGFGGFDQRSMWGRQQFGRMMDGYKAASLSNPQLTLRRYLGTLLGKLPAEYAKLPGRTKGLQLPTQNKTIFWG